MESRRFVRKMLPIKCGTSFLQGKNRFLMLLCAGCMICGATAKLTVRPQNYAVMRGQQDKMQCQSDGINTRLRWQRDLPVPASPEDREKEEIVFNGYNFSSHVASFCELIQGAVGEYSIEITAVDEAAQRYVCIEPGTLEKGSAELIMLESDPSCIDSSDDDYINATCTIHFRGNWPPEMHWTLNGEDVPETFVTEELHANKSLTSRLVLRRNLANYSISLTTNFTRRLKPSATTAENVPTYTHTWQGTEPPVSTTTNIGVAAIVICCSVAILLAIFINVFILCKKACEKRRQHKHPIGNSHENGGEQTNEPFEL